MYYCFGISINMFMQLSNKAATLKPNLKQETLQIKIFVKSLLAIVKHVFKRELWVEFTIYYFVTHCFQVHMTKRKHECNCMQACSLQLLNIVLFLLFLCDTQLVITEHKDKHNRATANR